MIPENPSVTPSVFPTEIAKDLNVEKRMKTLWKAVVLVAAVGCVLTPLLPAALAITALVILGVALLILLISEGARRFLKKPGIFGSIDYELFAICQAIGTYFKKDKEEKGNGQEPILFVHGYLHNSSGWLTFKKRLKKEGVTNPLYTISLGWPFNSIESYGEKVSKKIEEIKKQTGSKTVKLVGHSMGGLVSVEAENESVSKVITLGSPLEGTKTAFLGWGKSAKQMKQNSDFIRKVTEKIAKSPDKYTHFGSGGDFVILPQGSANPKGKGYKFSHAGHLFLLYSEEVAKEVAKELLKA